MSPLDPSLFLFHAAFAFLFGTIWGSFFNVVIWRGPRRFSIAWPGSHCPACGTPIRWYDNIPLLSQLLLDRRCRVCGVNISWRYFCVEFLTGLLFLAVFWQFRWSGATAVYLVFVSLLVVATFTDIDHYIIPDGVTRGGLIAGLVFALAGPWLGEGHLPSNEWPHWDAAPWRGIANAVLGAAVGWGIMKGIAVGGRILFRKEAMGGGDVTLMAMFGAFLGWLGVLATLLLSCFVGLGIGGSLLLMSKIREHRLGGPLPPVPDSLPDEIDPSTPDGFRAAVAHLDLHRRERVISSHLPFGPYLCIAALITLLLWPDVKDTLIFLYGGGWIESSMGLP